MRALGSRLLVVTTVLSVACSGPGLPGGIGAPSSVVTPAQAVQVVRDYWRANEQAAMSHDAELFSRIESGLQLEADAATARAARATATPGLAGPRPLRRVTVYVPRQPTYPAEFVALIETVAVDQRGQPTAQAFALYDHFRRAAAGARWLADFYSLADPGHPIRFLLDGAGYASALPANAGGFLLPPAAIAGSLATYLRSGLSSGRPSGPFAPGVLTTGSVSSQLGYQLNLARQGYLTSFDYASPPFSRAYRSADGAAIVLFALRPTATVTLTDPARTCIVQPPDQLQRWGGLLPAGRYSLVALDDLLQLVAADPPAHVGARIDVLTAADDQVAARAVPSPLSSCP